MLYSIIFISTKKQTHGAVQYPKYKETKIKINTMDKFCATTTLKPFLFFKVVPNKISTSSDIFKVTVIWKALMKWIIMQSFKALYQIVLELLHFNVAHFTSFCVHKIQLTFLKVDRHKGWCYQGKVVRNRCVLSQALKDDTDHEGWIFSDNEFQNPTAANCVIMV